VSVRLGVCGVLVERDGARVLKYASLFLHTDTDLVLYSVLSRDYGGISAVVTQEKYARVSRKIPWSS